MKKLSLAVVALAIALPSLAQKDKEVVATVNGQSITKKQFEEYHLQNLKSPAWHSES
jgi:sulfur carrier protein ThiS